MCTLVIVFVTESHSEGRGNRTVLSRERGRKKMAIQYYSGVAKKKFSFLTKNEMIENNELFTVLYIFNKIRISFLTCIRSFNSKIKFSEHFLKKKSDLILLCVENLSTIFRLYFIVKLSSAFGHVYLVTWWYVICHVNEHKSCVFSAWQLWRFCQDTFFYIWQER